MAGNGLRKKQLLCVSPMSCVFAFSCSQLMILDKTFARFTSVYWSLLVEGLKCHCQLLFVVFIGCM